MPERPELFIPFQPLRYMQHLSLPGICAMLVLSPSQAAAEAMAMRDYHFLDTGMSQAEVLYRVGPPDQESVFGDGIYGASKIIWYYIPNNSDDWITEIIFDSNGRIRDTRRYKP